MHEQLTEHSLIQLKEHIRLYVGRKILFIMLPGNRGFLTGRGVSLGRRQENIN